MSGRASGDESTAGVPRWVYAALCAVVAAVTAVGVWLVSYQGRMARRAAEGSLATIAQLKVDQIEAWRSEREGQGRHGGGGVGASRSPCEKTAGGI